MEKAVIIRTFNGSVMVAMFFLLSLVASSSCNNTVNIPVHVAAKPRGGGFSARVELYLPKDFREASWEEGSTTMPLGDHFSENAKVLARSLFSEVVVTTDDKGPTASGVDAVLIPRVISIYRHKDFFGETSSKGMSVIFQWTMSDKQGSTIWADTIIAQSEGEEMEQRVKSLMEIIVQESFDRMTSSPEIRSL